MAASFNRGRINCAPLTINPLMRHHVTGLPQSLEAVAAVYDYFPMVYGGIMVRVKTTGRLCLWMAGSLRNIDQRKATAALDLMQIRISENYDWRNSKKYHQGARPSDKGEPGTPEDAGI